MRDAAAALGFPLFEVPYEVPFIAITEKAFSHLVNEQLRVLQRALPRTSGSSGSCSPSAGSTAGDGALASLIGGPRWSSTAAARCSRAATAPDRCATTCSRRSAPSCASAPRGARRGYAPAGALRGRALALPVGAHGARRRATARLRRRGSWPPRTRAAGRVRPPRAATRRSPSWRSSCCAGASPTTRSGGSRATSSPRCCPAS
jgi:hypothetical protein